MRRPLRGAVYITTLLLTAGCGRATPETSEPAAAARPDAVTLTPDAMANAGIEVQPAASITRSDQLVAPGRLTLDETRTARVGSLQQALILDTPVQVGDRVRARQLVVRMHGHDLHDAWAGYHKALAERRRADHHVLFTTEAHERAKRLYADKAVALQDVQRAEADRVDAVQAVQMAKAEVTRSIEELEHVGVEAPTSPTTTEEDAAEAAAAGEQIPVRAPIGGIVMERLVTPGTTVTPGTPLLVISDLSSLWVVAEVDESHLGRVKAGGKVTLEVAAYPTERFPGTITFIENKVNTTTRRVMVRSTVANRDGRLKPEMFASVSLGEGEPRATVVVPLDAVQTLDSRQVVFVEQAAGRFVPRTVELGSSADGQVEVRSGVAAGDRVVAKGSFVLKSELLKAAGGEQ
jgi:cobalt-zinc-cadmium efflux system membrane fusion protein